jgi:hypothetical protein
MPKTRRLRTLRGGGTASWGFAPGSVDRTMNNPMAWARNEPSGPSTHTAPMGGGLPGLQKGGGGGTHYGFVGGGLAGGNASYPSNCALPQSGSGQLNVPVARSPLGSMAGGRRRSRSRNSRKSKSKSKKNRSRKSRR